MAPFRKIIFIEILSLTCFRMSENMPEPKISAFQEDYRRLQVAQNSKISKKKKKTLKNLTKIDTKRTTDSVRRRFELNFCV
jgi:Zn-dependent M16 (insulinase) family peptidase